ncbi:MAG: protein kinase [Candidatus Schekmanbacteria bacterium]|nr:protein kinase [Candidatus Schekmanbacteria bacterium]
MKAIGPYRILEPLGKGGMGVVWRAEHNETGAVVALKTVRVPDEAQLQSIRREIHALARLRHPGIVRIVDEGLNDGLPWYAMDLLEGQTLRLWWRELQPSEGPQEGHPVNAATATQGGNPAETASLALPSRAVASAPASVPDATPGNGNTRSGTPRAVSLDQLRTRVLSIIRRLCAPLAYLHGEGLVHRDLKPENVLVSSAGVPVLMDFGLAACFGGPLSREALEVDLGISGTLSYMAPEQARGERLDARADLYALGCILYEGLTGRTPFTGLGQREMLAAHISAQPLPPSKLANGLPPELDDLVMRLLSKEPRHRLGHAEDVGAALGRLGAADDEVAAAGPRGRAYLYRAGMTGRDSPLAALRERVRLAERGRGGLVLLGGESGVGKTRLVVELGREAVNQGVAVLVGECTEGNLESGGGLRPPLEPLRPPLRQIGDRCRERGADETELVFGARGRVLAEVEPSLADLPGQSDHPPLPALDPEAARLRLLMSLADTLAAAAEDEPLLLVLDDLQWADGLTLDLLGLLCRSERLASQALLVLGTYRSEETTDALERLKSAGAVQRLDLARLDETAVASIVGDMLAMQPPPPVFSRFLARHSEGNPFFVAEYLRLAVDQGLLARNGAGQWQIGAIQPESLEAACDSLPLPGSLVDVVRRRVEGLSENALRLVERLAVIGREGPIRLVSEAAGLQETALLEAIEELLRRHVLEEPQPGTLRFAHDRIREVVYGRIDKGRRPDLHRIVAESIEARYGSELDAYLTELAQHWRTADRPDKALVYLERAGERALSASANEEATRLFRTALELTDGSGQAPRAAASPYRRACWQRRLGDALSLAGRHRESRQHLVEAFAVLGRPLPTTPGRVAVRLLGQLPRLLLRPWRKREIAAARTPAQETALEAYRACERLQQVDYFLGDLPSSFLLAAYGATLAERNRLGPETARAYAVLGLGTSFMPLRFVAGAYFRRALQLARRTEDSGALATVLLLRGLYLAGSGALEEAVRSLEEAAHLTSQLGDRRQTAEAMGLKGLVHSLQGGFDKALAVSERLLAEARQMDDLQMQTAAALCQVGCLLRLGRLSEAVCRGSALVPLLAEDQTDDDKLAAQAMLALLELRQGRAPRALELAREAVQLATRVQPSGAPGVMTSGTLAQVCLDLRALQAQSVVQANDVGPLAVQACTSLRRQARVAPLGLPWSWYCDGRLLCLHGHRKRACRFWQRALTRAGQFGLSHLEGCLHLELGRHGPDPQQDAHLRQAREIFARLGTLPDLRRAEELLAARTGTPTEGESAHRRETPGSAR